MPPEPTVRQTRKEDEAAISAGLQQSSPGIVEYMGGRVPRLMRLLPIIEAAPHGPLQGGA